MENNKFKDLIGDIKHYQEEAVKIAKHLTYKKEQIKKLSKEDFEGIYIRYIGKNFGDVTSTYYYVKVKYVEINDRYIVFNGRVLTVSIYKNGGYKVDFDQEDCMLDVSFANFDNVEVIDKKEYDKAIKEITKIIIDEE